MRQLRFLLCGLVLMAGTASPSSAANCLPGQTTTCGVNGCAAWQYQVVNSCDASGNPVWSACGSNCHNWVDNSCGGSGTFANGSVSCPGQILQTSSCDCGGGGQPVTVAQCGSSCSTTTTTTSTTTTTTTTSTTTTTYACGNNGSLCFHNSDCCSDICLPDAGTGFSGGGWCSATATTTTSNIKYIRESSSSIIYP